MLADPLRPHWQLREHSLPPSARLYGKHQAKSRWTVQPLPKHVVHHRKLRSLSALSTTSFHRVAVALHASAIARQASSNCGQCRRRIDSESQISHQAALFHQCPVGPCAGAERCHPAVYGQIFQRCRVEACTYFIVCSVTIFLLLMFTYCGHKSMLTS